MRTDNNLMSKRRPNNFWAALAISAISAPVYSGDFSPITTHVEITYLDGQRLFETYEFSTAQEFSDTIDHKVINNPAYDHGADRPLVVATSDIQGNPVVISTSSNSNRITMTSESLGIHESFDGATRKDSVKQLEFWVKNNSGGIFQKVNAESALSTIGGVSGYLPRTPGLDSAIDGSGLSANVLKELAGGERESHLSVLTGFASYNADGKTADVYSFPISYNWEFKDGWALLLNVPLTYIETDGIASFSGSVGSGLRIPMSKLIDTGKVKWDLVPLFRVGAIGSEQNNVETSVIYSGGLQSNLGIPVGKGYNMVVQNQYNYYTVESVKAYTDLLVGGNSIEIPTISNSIYRNSVQLVKDFDYHLFGRTLMADITFADTRITGTKLAIDNQQEIGFDIGLRPASKSKFKLEALETAKEVLAIDKKKLVKKARHKLASTEFKLSFKYTIATGIDSAYGFSSSFSF
ncbi:MAG: hypothetical protein Q7U57_06045 [Methylovulum sp.]|nr:hypothetical protein [Methylovulum sp.]